ncbi:MAG TPA: hypothetical protein VEA16_01350 [Vicinamibacterales bacterium]|nr:hypothetical protein [Vicinamibacterales bacterium]
MIETIQWQDQIIAIIVRAGYDVEGIKFLTPNDFALQLGHMRRPTGYQVVPHTHNPVDRHTVGTQEVLFLKRGRIRVDFYTFEQTYVESRELVAGDLIMLAGAGHGIDVLEDATIVEVKNGPFIEGADKGRFPGKRT